MTTAISTLRIAALIALGFAFMLGQGWLLVGPLVRARPRAVRADATLFEQVPLALLTGLLINYGIILCFQSLRTSLIIGCLVALPGVFSFAIYAARRLRTWAPNQTTAIKWIGACIICMLYLGPILTVPLSEWDARSIWFFHAKMIYYAGSIGSSAGWQDPSVFFSHSNYPVLVPSLAAQVAYVMGYWNQYLPKLALCFVLVPGVIWVFSFARRRPSSILLLLFFPFGLGSWLWNGYMDGFLALYFGVALLLLGRHASASRAIDLIAALSCLVSLLYFKNEGDLAVVAGISAIIVCRLFSVRGLLRTLRRPMGWRYCFATLVVLLPFCLWHVYTAHWQAQDDFGFGIPETPLRLVRRLGDGSSALILHNILGQIVGPLSLLLVVRAASFLWRRRLSRESLLSMVATVVYSLGMIVIYLVAQRDLAWHLATSIERTMLSVNAGIVVASYYAAVEIEQPERPVASLPAVDARASTF